MGFGCFSPEPKAHFVQIKFWIYPYFEVIIMSVGIGFYLIWNQNSSTKQQQKHTNKHYNCYGHVPN